MPHTPAEHLTAAATTLLAAIDAIPLNDWHDRPWHVEECGDFDQCPCVVAQGERAPFDQAQNPLMQYIADAETPEYARYIALTHPGMGRALAELFTQAAADFKMCERFNSRDPDNDGKTRIMPHTIAGAALAVAKKITSQDTR